MFKNTLIAAIFALGLAAQPATAETHVTSLSNPSEMVTPQQNAHPDVDEEAFQGEDCPEADVLKGQRQKETLMLCTMRHQRGLKQSYEATLQQRQEVAAKVAEVMVDGMRLIPRIRALQTADVEGTAQTLKEMILFSMRLDVLEEEIFLVPNASDFRQNHMAFLTALRNEVHAATEFDTKVASTAKRPAHAAAHKPMVLGNHNLR